MARPKSTTTTPKAKTLFTPKSAPAIPAVLTKPSPAPQDNNNDDDISDADSAPVTAAAAATPARKQAKRKAPLDDATSTPAPHSTTKKPKVSVHTEQSTVTSTSASGKKSTRKQRNVHIEIPVVSTPKGKHIVFNDDDADDADDDDGPSEFFTPQENGKANGLEAQLLATRIREEQEEEEEEEDSDDDDDEAPEAVSTSTAAAQAAKATQAAARAAELQQDGERRKRQERDARFKKQAEARKKQQEAAAAAAAAAAPVVDDNDDSDDDDDDDTPAAAKAPRAPRLVTSLSTSSRARLDRRTLPSVLPDEFLASDSEADGEEHGGGTAARARPQKITFNTAARQAAGAAPRHPADQRVGATVYRVLKTQGEARLAPRGGKYSRNAKEALLARGRRTAPPRTSGATKTKGFLVGSR